MAGTSLADNSSKRVLILHSYHQGFHWTDRIMAGIQSTFEEHENIELFVNYMDTKRHSSEQYFEQLKTLYSTKFQHVKFDAIISSDDLALDFLLKYRDQLFPGTPVVFSGLNNFSDDRLNGQSGYTGIYEKYDVAGTIDLMLKIHPNTKQITTIADSTRSGKIFDSMLRKVEPLFANTITFNHIRDASPQAIQQSLQQLPKNSLVLWAIYLRTPSGTTLSSGESVKFVSENSPVATYCIWDVVGQGVVGGKITSPNYQGNIAAKMVLRLFSGEDINQIEVIGSPLTNILDFRQMQRFNIKPKDVPAGSIFLNKPESFYERYFQYVWVFAVITFLLLVTIIFLITIIMLKKKRDIFEGMAMHDQLTGLYNRYYLQEVAVQKLSEAIRHKEDLCLLVLDLDHFKLINDTHGHQVGDDVLCSFSTLLLEHNRSEDLVARIGGEEFVILLNHCNATRAIEKAQSLRQLVANSMPHNLTVTVSIGIAELHSEGEPFDNLLKRADEAVYQAKENGRNCVVFL